MRAAKARDAVAKLGLEPKMLVRKASVGQGGPFIPWRGRIGRAGARGQSFAARGGAPFRLEVPDRTLVAIPSGRHAQLLMLSYGYGHRTNAFTGARRVP